MLFESVIHSGPVTALYLGENFILAGIGSFLHVYCNDERGNWTNKSVTEVLPGRNIHRIKHENKDSSKFIVFGQKCLRLIGYDSENDQVKPLQELIEFSDWIWDVTWVQDKPEQVCLALGHNVVVILDLTTGKPVQTVSCEEKCILYCAKFVSDSSDSLVLAAGTVFNQVVLWSPVCQTTNDRRVPVEPFHRLTGHQGVIFSIDYNRRLQTLCSASDDRSLRLYKMDFPNKQTDPCMADWVDVNSTLLHVLYGHQARVWDVRLLSNVLISVGEDSTCCVWSYEGNIVQKFKGHRGKSIWSIAAAASEDRVATGGGDHSIRLWRLQSELQSPLLTARDIDFKMKPTDFPRNTMLLDFNKVLAITNEGCILLYDCDTTDVTCLMSDSAFSSYTVMAVSKVKHFVVVGNINGVIRVLYAGQREDKQSINLYVDKKIYDGKVFSVHFVTDDIIITTGPNGSINVLQINLFDDHLSATPLYQMVLSPSRHRWVTTASFLHGGSHIVCGDRTGSVFLYKLAGSDEISELVQTFPKIHGKAGVTDICCHGDFLYTCGRDGLYRLFTWSENDSDTSLICQNSNRVFKGFEWLERIVFTPEGDTWIFGFHANLFVIWSMNQNQKVLEIDCGGGHRTWDYISTGNKGQFVYIKTREVMVTDVSVRSNQTVVKSSVHGREVCDVKHLYSHRDASDYPLDVLITCSEDTTLNVMLAKYTNGIPELSILHTLSGHISSVRCIAVCTASQSHSSDLERTGSMLVISGGGRAQIRIWRINVKKCDTIVQTDFKLCNSNYVCSESSNDARINNILDYKHINAESQTLANDIEILKNDTEIAIDNSVKDEDVGSAVEEITLSLASLPDSIQTDSLSTYVASDVTNTVRNNTNVPQTVKRDPHLNELNVSNDCTNASSTDTPEHISREHIQSTVSNIETGYVTLSEISLGKAGRRTKKPWRYPADNSDPETRVLDLCVFHGQEISQSFVETLYFFAAACSDGFIRLFLFEENSRETTLISSSKFHDHCVLKTCYFSIPCKDTSNRSELIKDVTLDRKLSYKQRTDVKGCSDNQATDTLNHIVLLSAATDGKVAFYDITNLCYKYAVDNGYMRTGISIGSMGHSGGNGGNFESDGKEMSPMYSVQLHQSGVNSIHCKHLSDDMYTLMTGGDDNALTVSYISVAQNPLNNTLQMEVMKKGCCLSAHSAQVTGVWGLGNDLVLSVSIDQRMCLWKVQETGQSLEISMVDCKVVNVSDVSNIDVFTNSNGQYVIISGEGIQLFKINNTDCQLSLEDTITKHTQLIL